MTLCHFEAAFITPARPYLTYSDLRIRASSNPVDSVPEVFDGKNL